MDFKIFDSNIWIARLDHSDSQNKKATEVFDKLNSKLLLTTFLISEICTILQFKAGKERSDFFLNFIKENKDIQILEDFDFSELLDFYLQNNFKKLSFVDRSLLLLSKGFEIVTFDKDLEKALKNYLKN